MKYKITNTKEIKDNVFQIEINNKYGFVYSAKNEEEAIDMVATYLKVKKRLISEYSVKGI